jgi:hypothetical protein
MARRDASFLDLDRVWALKAAEDERFVAGNLSGSEQAQVDGPLNGLGPRCHAELVVDRP